MPGPLVNAVLSSGVVVTLESNILLGLRSICKDDKALKLFVALLSML